MTGAGVLRVAWAPAVVYAAPSVDTSLPLYAHQRETLRVAVAILERYGGVLLADDVGLGKSYVALALALHQGAPPWIAVPAALRDQWRALVDDLGVTVDQLVTHTQLSRGTAPAPAAGALLLVDEAHRFRNPHTKRYLALADLARGHDLVLATATPVQNRAQDLVALVHLFVGDTELHRLSGGDAERLATCVVVGRDRADITPMRRTRRQHVVVESRLPVNPTDLAPIFGAVASEARVLFGYVYLKRLASSPEAALATVRRARNYLQRLHEAQQAGASLDRSAFRRAFGDDPDLQLAQQVFSFWYQGAVDTVVNGLAERVSALVQLEERLRGTSLAHGDRLARVRTLAAQPGRTLVFSDYAETVDALRRELRGVAGVYAWTGRGAWVGASRVSGAKVVERFLCDPLARLLIATDVASEGLNLQTAHRVLHFDLPWNPARLAQRMGRVDRLGGAEVVEQWLCRPHPELEAALRLAERLALKRALIHRTLAVARGRDLWAIGGSAGLTRGLYVSSMVDRLWVFVDGVALVAGPDGVDYADAHETISLAATPLRVATPHERAWWSPRVQEVAAVWRARWAREALDHLRRAPRRAHMAAALRELGWAELSGHQSALERARAHLRWLGGALVAGDLLALSRAVDLAEAVGSRSSAPAKGDLPLVAIAPVAQAGGLD